jgi:hypothetical protein
MKTASALNVRPDRYESEKWPTRVPDLPDRGLEPTEAHSLDPTQGSKVGSEPYDDPTQGRQIGSDPYDDATQGRTIGSDLYEEPRKDAWSAHTRTTIPARVKGSDLIPTTTRPEAGSTVRPILCTATNRRA